ncbi:phage shock protein operon transcriptional activator [Frateuria sp. STR12]|uniref:phage shock protein operon transcriptional activator n=1 Tax=Frateuria hangzhouensis TaxID=2995589 RepID=UPI002260DB67|nr:phage shock protein operon transcriptional activator [Frateuria sp. STR12]MCX7514658.1 phage shock protein operon transcriptional activator [Frateuria sp. STR12]
MPDPASFDSQATTMLGESPAFLDLLEHASRVAAVNKPVLVIGERGTGKELIAARLHYLSPRWEAPLVKLNCATLTEALLETELFGHEAGAFTGATRRHIGRFEQAHGGTLFLDELATVSMRVQEKILRAVEYGQFERVGGSETLTVDVRIVGATNGDMPAAVRAGQFRADLLDRLAFDVLTVPPLRARTGDIMQLAEHFALDISRELGRELFAGFTEAASAALIRYPWPGNVRELKNAVERSVHRSVVDEPVDAIVFDPFASAYRPPVEVEPGDPAVAPPERPAPLPCDLKSETARLEVDLLRRALAQARYSQAEAASLLGLSYHQMRALLRKHGMVKPRGSQTGPTAA